MILIAHRGNTNGRIPEKENRPEYIDKAIKSGYDVEVDLWLFNQWLYLGHDAPLFDVTYQWLLERSDKLWIHCKNTDCLVYMSSSSLNYFWHETDRVTLTSKRYIWAHPGVQPIIGSIAVLPERNGEPLFSLCRGVCSDFISSYK